MRIFKDTTFTWQQLSLFKISIFAFGLALGAVWWDVVLPYVDLLLVVAVPATLYVTYAWFHQHR
ncbi:MAG: hypothetical protein KBE09_04910 [Candidatus Pacebacteria bacterium]|nr:hypothetical protein [Candidatus Paceibacterota bacterium]